MCEHINKDVQTSRNIQNKKNREITTIPFNIFLSLIELTIHSDDLGSPTDLEILDIVVLYL